VGGPTAGITTGIDLALAMVTEDHGEEIAQQTARQLVLHHRRSGGQSQFSSLLELKAPSGRFGELLTWAREHLDAPLRVENLAEQGGMNSRHFARAFIAETGTTPSKAVERLRIEVARLRVQSSSEAIERVAQLTGFRDPERMRRAFIRAFGQPAIAAPRGAGGVGRPRMHRRAWEACMGVRGDQATPGTLFTPGELRALCYCPK
jgi:transcriptional regulator GlxA family with amidase domain